MNLPIRLGLFALFMHAAAAQTQPEVADILRKVTAAYKPARQYEFELDSTETTTGRAVVSHLHFVYSGPDKYRFEGTLPGIGASGDKGTIVDDGSTVWIYLAETNEYASMPVTVVTAPAPMTEIGPAAMDHLMTWRYRGAAEFIASGAALLRQESLETARGKVACYVVAVPLTKGGFTYTWWIDKATFRILREDDSGNSSVFTTVKLNEPLAEDLLKFEPPPGATRVKMK